MVVGLSGGVDSAVSAYLLKEQGYEVLGVFMQNWEDDEDNQYCTIKTDSLDAIAVADCLDIDIEIINFAKEYQERVFSYFLSQYKLGLTPNPDIFCNSEIKFNAFLDYAMQIGADYIATGHYAQIYKQNNSNGSCQYQLIKGIDANKDQSYFLYRLNQYQLSKAIFPLGNMLKTTTREIAKSINLPNANKKDSTGICFIGKRPFKEFLTTYMGINDGDIVSTDGDIIGKHNGLMYYTIGQRKGLGIGGIKNNNSNKHDVHDNAWYVCDKNLSQNQLIVAQGHNSPYLFKQQLTASQAAFINNTKPHTANYNAKIRYRMQDAQCRLNYLDNNIVELSFSTPQFAITPGQSVVLYDNNICLGGAIINNWST